MKTFLNQALLTITLDVGIDISAATVKKILYKKPDGTSGFWTASALNTTFLTYALQAGDINQRGEWHIQAYVEFSGKAGYGEVCKLIVAKGLDV